MAEEEHPNTEEPMNTQELLNIMVASQIQLREDMNHMVQQFQNLRSNQEENMTDLIHCWGPFVEAQQTEEPNNEGHKELIR